MKIPKKIVAAGHVCLDISPVFPETLRGEISQIFSPGKLVNVENAEVHIGGPVGNTGLALKFFGAEVRLMGKVGDDAFGRMAVEIVKQHGIDSGLIVSQDSHTSYSVVLALPGKDRIFLHHPGANDTFTCADLDLKAVASSDWFHFGYPPLMKQLYIDGGRELVKLFKTVSDLGVSTSLDMVAVDPTSPAGTVDWAGILAKTLLYVDLFAPSVEELLFMLDQPALARLRSAAPGSDITRVIELERDVKPLAEKALRMGAGLVLIKCGASGMFFAASSPARVAQIEKKLGFALQGWAGEQRFEPGYQAERVLSATGAGDAAIAAFICALLQELPLGECLQYAAGAGACCVTEYDSLSGLQSFDQMKHKITAGWPKINAGV